MSSNSSEPGIAADAGVELAHVTKAFGGFVAVDIGGLSIPRTGVTALIGPNGAGKTTLFDLLSGFTTPTTGTIRYGGRDVTAQSPDRRARAGLVRTFQLTRVFERMSVTDNMLIGTLPGAHLHLATSVFRPRHAAKRQRMVRALAADLLEHVGLAGVANLPAGGLSGGQKKLLEFARALMCKPSILLLDEPMAGVNPTVRERLIDLIRGLVATGVGVVFVEHDLPRVMALADRIVVLDRGKVIANGAPDLITADTAVVEAYLGGGGAWESPDKL